MPFGFRAKLGGPLARIAAARTASVRAHAIKAFVAKRVARASATKARIATRAAVVHQMAAAAARPGGRFAARLVR